MALHNGHGESWYLSKTVLNRLRDMQDSLLSKKAEEI